MKKRLLMITLALVILLTASLMGACKTSDQADVIELTYSNFFPPTHFNSILAEEWIKEIETRTDGAVDITYYPGSALTPAAQAYDAVVQGIADIAMSLFAYTPGRFPACEIVDLPHSYPNGWVATQVTNDFYNEFMPEELDDVHPLYFHGHGPGVIFTTDTPVETMEDLDGLVIRATGVGATIVEALGAEGYGAAQGDAYELMSKGVIDGSYTPREVLKGWNQADVVKYVTNSIDIGNTTMMFVVMNPDKWDSLPADIKTVFTEVSQEWIVKHGMVWDYYDKIGIDYFLSLSGGREVIELDEAEIARWVETAVDPLIEQYISDKTGLGLAAADFHEYVLGRVAYWAELSPALEESVTWVQENLEPLVE